MKKHRDLCAIGIIFIITLIIVISIRNPKTVYGSQTDWASQHAAIPEYFRTLFYDTGSLLPSYAFNLGAGENIFSLSYYGYLSPVILPAYLLKSVPMDAYIMIVSVVCVLISEALFYVLFRRRYSLKIAFFCTLFFALSMPLILNTHKHIMYLSYMPFMLLSLIGAEYYFEKGKKFLLSFSFFLTIMCCYYFAPTEILALFCYGIWLILLRKEEKPVRKLVTYCGCILVGVLAASVLILPSAYAMLSGRDMSASSGFDYSVLIPALRFDMVTYDSSSMGLSAFGVFCAMYFLIKGQRHQKFVAGLVLAFSLFPVLIYILNGTLYVNPKVLFVFLPMAMTLVGDMFKIIGEFNSKRILLGFLIVSLLAFFANPENTIIWGYIADAVVVSISLYAYILTKKKAFVYMLFVVPLIMCVGMNNGDKLADRENFELANSKNVANVIDSLESDSIYRTAIDTARIFTVNKVYSPRHYTDTVYSSLHSKPYNNFYFNEMFNENEYRNSALTTRSRNIFFNAFMGNRYYISHKPLRYYGLSLKETTDEGLYVYENNLAYPMIYSRKKVMSSEQYNSLGYPEKMAALLKYTIVPEDVPDVDYENTFAKIDLSDLFADIPRKINKAESYSYSYKLPKEARDKILLIRFYVKDIEDDNRGWDSSSDVRITINGIKNTLTNKSWKYFNGNNYFEYVISDMTNELNVLLYGEAIEISDIEAYAVDEDMLSNMVDNSFVEPTYDIAKTHGDQISFEITTDSPSYITTSLAYQQGFKVIVDGNSVTPTKVNTAFLGFKLDSGHHDVLITYKAPFLIYGIVVTCFALLCMLFMLVGDVLKKS